MSRAAVLSAISALCCCAWPAVADDFQLACHPFSLPSEARPIDGKCGSGGSAAHGPNTPENRAKEAQNRRKNALCRQEAPVTPVTLTMADFMALQTQAQHQGIQFGAEGSGGDRKEHLPPDRTRLDSQHFRTVHGRPVGEGTWVQIVGFMNEPHPGGKEDVNCESTDNSDKDVHINLVGSAAPWLPAKTDPSKDEKEAIRNAALCKGIVAETIPHFRPDLFEASPLRSVAKQEFPVLISGQLFFDASHFPCEGDVPHHGGHPARGSIWEIHPITSIQVCKNKTLHQCPAEDANVWTPLHEVPAHFLAASTAAFAREMESEPDED